MKKINRKFIIWYIFNTFVVLILSYYAIKTSVTYLDHISYKPTFTQRVNNLSVLRIKDREYLTNFLKCHSKILRNNNIMFPGLILLLLLYSVVHIYIIDKINKIRLKNYIIFLCFILLIFVFSFWDVLNKTYISGEFIQKVINNKQIALAKQYALLYYDQIDMLILKYLLFIFISIIIIIILSYINYKQLKSQKMIGME